MQHGALVLVMLGLAYAMRALPVGTSCAVWGGSGAVLTVGVAIAIDEKAVSAVAVLLLAGIVGGGLGLKLLH